MRIELFGYYFYPAFFVTIIGVPLIIVLGIIFFKRFREKRAVYSSSLITSWQKKNIDFLLEDEISRSTSEDYSQKLSKIKEYLLDCKYWNNEELLEIDKDSIIILTSILFDEIRQKHIKDPDRSVLLLHSIDLINGGLDFSDGGLTWMNTDLPEMKNHEEMKEDETRVISLCASLLEKTTEEYVNIDSGLIPEITDAIPELIGKHRDEFAEAYKDVTHTIDFREIPPESFTLLELVFLDVLKKLIDKLEEDYFEDYYLSYFRTFACVIDRQLYDDILDSIEN